MKRASWIVPLALALPACGGDSSATVVPPPVIVASPSPVPSPVPSPSPVPTPTPTPEPTPTPDPTPTATPEPPPHPEPLVVNIVGMAFSPSTVTAKLGQKVIWKNKDITTHTATADAGEFSTGFIDPGGQASITVQFEGEANYHCSVHPSMQAILTGTK
jgi:plastocyanin